MFFDRIEPIWTETLRAAVENAYEVFGAYTLRGPPVVCRCDVCVSEEHHRLLGTTPLRELPAWLLGQYNDSAHGWDTAVVEPEFAHFLPRILELVAGCDPPTTGGLDFALKNLGEADYRRRWTVREIAAVDRVLAAFVAASLGQLATARWPVGWRLEFDMGEVLAMAILARADLPALLEVWRAAPDPAAAVHVAALRWSHVRWKDGWPRFARATVESHHEAAEMVGAFALDPDWTRRIEASFFACDDPRLREVLSAGADL